MNYKNVLEEQIKVLQESQKFENPEYLKAKCAAAETIISLVVTASSLYGQGTGEETEGPSEADPQYEGLRPGQQVAMTRTEWDRLQSLKENGPEKLPDKIYDGTTFRD